RGRSTGPSGCSALRAGVFAMSASLASSARIDRPRCRGREVRECATMPTGRVKFYDEDKGFGFIQSDEGQEVFLHASAVPDGAAIKSGSRLEFGIVDGKRGAQAL